MATEIVVTTLPNGSANGRARLSVLLSPRLLSNESEAQLSEFAFDMWTDKAKGLGFKVYFGSTSVVVDADPASDALVPDTDLWTILFPSNTFVRPYAFPVFENAEILSYAVNAIFGYTEDTYAKLVAEAPSDLFLAASKLAKQGYFGPVTPPTELINAKDKLVTRGSAVAEDSEDALEKRSRESAKLNISATAPAPPKASVDFHEGDKFFAVKNTPRLQNIDVPGRSPVNPRIDFHQMVTLLAKHPKLQRLLGFAFDLEIDLPGGLGTTVNIWTRPVWPSGAGPEPQYKIPKTKTRMKGFKPVAHGEGGPRGGSSEAYKPTEPYIQAGLLNLSNTFPDGHKVFGFFDLDTDSAAVNISRFGKTISSTLNLQLSAQRASTDAVRQAQEEEEPDPLEDKLAAPSLRSPGLSLVEWGRSYNWLQKIKLAFAQNKTLEVANADGVADEDVVFLADDLVRGYAIDIFDEESDRWFPLTARSGTATFYTDVASKTGVDVPLEPRDGWVSLGATKTPKDPASDDGAKDEYYVHESMFRWLNWSLVVPRPGKALDENDNVPDQKFANLPETEFPLGVIYEVPSTEEAKLPILRYGRTYRARARIVDLAGNATPFGSPTAQSFAQTTDPTPFTRLEPVPSPALLMRKPITPGESVERMVIRSNYDTQASATAPNERHIAPPKIDVYGAELHGMFDTPSGLDPAAYPMIAARAGGSFDDSAIAKPDPDNHGVPYFDVDKLSFPVESGKTSKIPYLPDPLARGAAFYGLPGTAPSTASRLLYDNQAEWPDWNPHRLRLKEGPPSNDLDVDGHVLDISLPKGEIRTVRYGSYHTAASLPELGLMRWFARSAIKPVQRVDFDEEESQRINLLGWIRSQSRRFLNGSVRPEDAALAYLQSISRDVQAGRFRPRSDQERRLAQIVGGTNPMIAPFRIITLVHAVRQPLIAPKFNDPAITRKIGWTYADFSDTVEIDTHSTIELDVHAAWTEVVDRFDTDGVWEPRAELPMQALAFKYQLPYELRGFRQGPIGRQEFGDTKFREIRYTGVATTRFKDYFTEHRTLPVSGSATFPSDPDLLGETGVVPGSETVKSADRTITYTRDVDYTMNYATGVLTVVAGRIPSGSIDVTYVVPPITRETEQETVVRVPSSARPAAPKVLYVVPTFKWTRTATDDKVESKREGRGLRVYLDRPWWSSGDEEKLGVIVRPPTTKTGGGLSSRVVPFISRWGLDPLWGSAPTSNYPETKDFETGTAGKSVFTLAEAPGLLSAAPKVAVRAHDVGFDESRRLWFCDIVMKTPAYTPFVRLALARYQPNSIENAHLSRVVLADIMQLTPDRSLSVTFDPADATKVKVFLSGISYLKGPAGKGPATVEVSLEQRRPEVDDVTEELGWSAVEDSTTQLQGSMFLGATGWSGTIALPLPLGEQRFRLVIKEFERIGSAAAGRGAARKRLVYVETVELAGPEQPPNLPDLTISLTSETSFTVKNIGLGAVGPFSAVVRDAAGLTLQTFDFTGLGAGQEAIRQVPLSSEIRTVVVDPGDQIDEVNENNNSLTIPASTQKPDLAITATTTTSFTIKNVGLGDAGPFTARMQNTATGAVLQDFQFSGLASGQQVVQTVTSSTQARTVFLDPLDDIDESNESNNSAPIPTTSSPSPSPTAKPDLRVSATSQTSFTIKNDGTAAAGAFQAQVKQTSNGAVLSTHNFTGLAAGGTVTITVPLSAAARTVTVDSANQVAESNESNNSASIPVALPDLIISATTTDSFTIKNQGQGPAGAFQAQVKFSNGSVDSTHSFSGLAVGATVTRSISESAANRTVTADSANQLQESNEANNSASIPVQIPG